MTTTRQGGVAVIFIQRKKDQSIVINDDITVTVIEVRGDKVRLGIEYPREVTVHPLEVYEAIQGQDRRPADTESRP
jgi:carbon storage regulator